ncbi:MAG TPA: hypothetical protein VFK50_07110 [Sphingomicrobium sp.]|nr:hypothetical protein [Sphingomicrobium sp.]
MIAKLAVAAPALLSMATAPMLFSERQGFAGIHTAHLEFSEFNGCWLEFAPSAYERYRRLVPQSFDLQRVRIAFIGRGTARLRGFKRGSGYGHMGMYPCQIEVLELRSAAPLPPR